MYKIKRIQQAAIIAAFIQIIFSDGYAMQIEEGNDAQISARSSIFSSFSQIFTDAKSYVTRTLSPMEEWRLIEKIYHIYDDSCSTPEEMESLITVYVHEGNVNTKSGFDITLLRAACNRGWLGAVTLLLERGAATNVRINELKCQVGSRVFDGLCDNKEGSTPLHIASYKGYPDIIRILLKHDIELLEKRDDCERTALHVASSFANNETVTLLLSFGPEINSEASDGWTSLDFARYFKKTKNEQILVAHGGVSGTN